MRIQRNLPDDTVEKQKTGNGIKKISNKKSDNVFMRHPGEDYDVDRTDETDRNSSIKAYDDAARSKGKTNSVQANRKTENMESLKTAARAVSTELTNAGYGKSNPGLSSMMAAAKSYSPIGASNPPNGPKKRYDK